LGIFLWAVKVIYCSVGVGIAIVCAEYNGFSGKSQAGSEASGCFFREMPSVHVAEAKLAKKT
jgi:hypothetical protein